MSNIPDNLMYDASHEWIRIEGDVATIGITDHAQDQLGDLVFVELPDVGDELEKGDSCAVVESVKAASDVYSPLSGEVLEVNEELADSPESINESPYEAGWLFKLRVTGDTDHLVDAAGYQSLLDS